MEDRAPPPAPEDEDEGRSVLARLLLWFGFGLASLALFAAALVVVLDTGPGRRFVADQIQRVALGSGLRSEEHTSELQSLMRISYAVFCLKKKKKHNTTKETLIRETRQ